MGNSNTTLQNVVDFARTIGDLNVQLAAGGYGLEPALTIANDVMIEMLAQRFNWKFNRMGVPPFYINSWQQDYAMVGLKTIGWLEHCCAVDINNTATPKPLRWIECVRDLERTSAQFSLGWPGKICWLPNDQLVQGTWPGATKTYTNPLGAVALPSNPTVNIKDANGNILVLTTYGITGSVAPVLAALSQEGTTVNDGTCVWTVADPKSQGFRLMPMPSQSGIVLQINVTAQMLPPKFATFSTKLDPIPDDYAKHFRDGFIAFMHRHSATPAVRNRYEQARRDWLSSLADARATGDREKEDAGFIPATTLLDGGGVSQPGPAWPYGNIGPR